MKVCVTVLVILDSSDSLCVYVALLVTCVVCVSLCVLGLLIWHCYWCIYIRICNVSYRNSCIARRTSCKCVSMPLLCVSFAFLRL